MSDLYALLREAIHNRVRGNPAIRAFIERTSNHLTWDSYYVQAVSAQEIGK